MRTILINFLRGAVAMYMKMETHEFEGATVDK